MTDQAKKRRAKHAGANRAEPDFLIPRDLPRTGSDLTPLVQALISHVFPGMRLPPSLSGSIAAVGSLAEPARQTAAGPLSPTDSIVQPGLHHLFVQFLLESVENIVIDGPGVTGSWAAWDVNSSVATEEQSLWSYPLPEPGETLTYGFTIYRAIVQSGCQATPLVPVTFQCLVFDTFDHQNQLGEFNGVDNTTLQPALQPPGWIFTYKVRATATNGDISDFRFRGDVKIACTNLSTF